MPRLANFIFGNSSAICLPSQLPVSESPTNTTASWLCSRWLQNQARLSIIHGKTRIGPLPGQAAWS